jgi:hypothetical protein
MTDPKRLLEEGTALEASILGAALDDAPRKGLDRRIHAALGIGGIAIGATTASTTAAAASKAAPALVSFGIAKWAGIVAIGASAVVGAAAVARHESMPIAPPHGPVVLRPPSGAIPAPTAVPVAELGLPPSAPVADPTSDPGPAEAMLPRAPAARAAEPTVSPAIEAPSAPSRVALPPSMPGLSSELDLVDRANAALDSGDAQRAITLLDRHDLDFLHGRLAPEALELRIRAYALRHDDVKVVDLGKTFLSRYPDSPLVPRVRALIGESERH